MIYILLQFRETIVNKNSITFLVLLFWGCLAALQQIPF